MKKNDITTLQMEIALMKYIKPRRNLVVPNVYWGADISHECDLLYLSPVGYATEIEIKISRGDLKADLKKRHRHHSNKIKRLFFAVPAELKQKCLELAPARAGILIVEANPIECQEFLVTEIRKAVTNKYATKWTERQRLGLARLGTLRISRLKEKINKLQNELNQR